MKKVYDQRGERGNMPPLQNCNKGIIHPAVTNTSSIFEKSDVEKKGRRREAIIP